MTTIKVLGKEYRVRSDDDPRHVERAAEFLNQALEEIQRTTPDSQDAAILAALNMASDLLRLRANTCTMETARLHKLIDLVDSV